MPFDVLTWVNELKELSLEDVHDLLVKVQANPGFKIMTLELHELGETVIVYTGEATDEELTNFFAEYMR